MKASRLVTLFAVALLAVAVDCQAQTGSKPDQVMEQLLTEVHQLRVAMQQMSVNAYRGQIMVERLRLQQDQVSRLTREIASIRNEIAEIKSAEPLAKERLDDAEKKLETGMLSEIKVKELRASSFELKRRQERLLEREAELSIELTQERNALGDLNNRLDALEREIVITGLGTEKTNRKK